MKISYNWLSQYIPQEIPVEELSVILTSIGLEVENIEKIERIKGGLEGLVVGEIVTCDKHENADKLSVTTVKIDEENTVPIVCGAPNVAVGQKVIVALPGTTIYPTNEEAFTIKKAKIRGMISEGMICSEVEIGIGTDASGIMVLPKETRNGTLAKDYFELPQADFTIQIGLTPNRSDANSHIGVAKDVCAYLSHHQKEKIEVIYPDSDFKNQIKDKLPLTIEIKNKEACPRYAGAVLSGIQIKESPEWLQKKLLAIGIHPINNVVDITNFVLHEYGQPLHAFDYQKITGQKIIVSNQEEGHLFETLDAKEIKLRHEDLMICDAGKPMCLAGVFGGLNSGISESTTSIFIESAYFDPKTIRRTSMHHGLRTEAATHFEKSVDINLVIPALERAIFLLQEIEGAKLASELFDYFPNPKEDKVIELSYKYLNQLCGKDYQQEEVKSILQSLGFEIKSANEESIKVLASGYHTDIHLPADLVEEILRIDGLDNIEIPTRLNISLQDNPQNEERQVKERIAQYLAYSGLQEIITNSITNSKYYSEENNIVSLINSLSSELDVMRPQMLESGLEVINYNANRKQQDLLLFEFGKIYNKSKEGVYHEKQKLSIWISGNVNKKHWQGKTKAADIYFIKGLIYSIFELCGINKTKEQIKEDLIDIRVGKSSLATIQKVATEKLKYFDIKQTVFYAEIDFATLIEKLPKAKVQFKELPKFPAMKRDLALVLDKNVTYKDVEKVIGQQQVHFLKDYELFDIFENEKLGEDKKSLALSFNFQLYDRTLTDKEVDQYMQQLIKQYEQDLNAIVRTG